MSKQNDAILFAYDKGYRVMKDGSVQGLRVGKMSLYSSDTRYLRFNVRLPLSKWKVHVKVHRLAAYQKYGKFWERGLEVDHVNGDTLDNRLENINVVTHKENVRKAHSPLCWEDVRRIRRLYSGGKRGIGRALAKEYGVSSGCIYGIASGRNWREKMYSCNT